VESQLYPYARQLFATAGLDWTTGDYRALLLPESYVPDFEDQFLSDIFSGVRIATSELIEDRTAVDGICTGTHARFPLLFTTARISQAIIYKDTLDEATSVLVAYLGSDDLINDPFQGLGLTYFIYPNALEGGFFRL
jgi:hypothetical protein